MQSPLFSPGTLYSDSSMMLASTEESLIGVATPSTHRQNSPNVLGYSVKQSLPIQSSVPGSSRKQSLTKQRSQMRLTSPTQNALMGQSSHRTSVSSMVQLHAMRESQRYSTTPKPEQPALNTSTSTMFQSPTAQVWPI